MLSRSQRSHFTQENPQQQQPAQRQQPTKTPARQLGAGGAGGAVGKGPGPLTAKRTVGRVLGQKDVNGKQQQQQAGAGSTLLFPGKASTSNAVAGPSCAPAPAKQAAPTLPSHLRTPSPGLHKFAPLSFSPEVELDVEVQQEEREMEVEEDREVEGAGFSSADYEEPYDPGFPMLDFKTAGLGAGLRATPFFACEDYAEWEKRDEEERKEFRAVMDEQLVRDEFIDDLFDTSKPMFPVPKLKRQALASKPANAPASVLGNSTNGRRPPLSAATSPRASSAVRKPLGTASTSTTTNKPNWGAPLPSRKPLSAAAPSATLSRSLGPSSAAPRPTTRPPLSAFKSASAVPSRLAGTSSKSSLSAPTSAKPKPKPSLVGDVEAERELGAFGIVEDLELGALSVGDELGGEEFAFVM